MHSKPVHKRCHRDSPFLVIGSLSIAVKNNETLDEQGTVEMLQR